jgi:hypothetical protein
LIHPLNTRLYTKLYSKRLKNISVDYQFEFLNPVAIGLLLENGKITISSFGQQPFSENKLNPVLIKANESCQIKGTIDLRPVIGKVIIAEFIKNHPLTITFSANLRLPDTDISIPLRVESVSDFDFTLLK